MDKFLKKVQIEKDNFEQGCAIAIIIFSLLAMTAIVTIVKIFY